MENQSCGFAGVWIPKEILCCEELSAGEKILYANIASFEKACFESNFRLAEKCGMAERSVSSGLKKLQELGFVFVEMVGGNSAKRRVYALRDSPKKVKYLIAKGLLRANQQSFLGVENSADLGGSKNCEGSKICEGGRKICEPLTDGGSQKLLPKNNKEEKRESVPHFPVENSEDAGLAGGNRQPALPSKNPKREDFDSDEDWYEACCAANSVRI